MSLYCLLFCISISNGGIIKFYGGFYFISSHLTMVENPCADFSCALTWICAISYSSDPDEWRHLVTAASVSSGFQSRPTETWHPTRAYCSNKFSAGCCLALHLGNMRPRNFSYMTSSGPVNSSSNRRCSSVNAVADLFSHQCCGTLSRFWFWLYSYHKCARLAIFTPVGSSSIVHI